MNDIIMDDLGNDPEVESSYIALAHDNSFEQAPLESEDVEI